MARKKLFKTSKVDIIRKTTTGDYNDKGDWVEGVLEEPISIECNIQPFNKGTTRVEKPEGVTSKDMRIIYTKTLVYVVDEYTNQEPDEIVINGIPYVAFDIEDWNLYGMSNDHYAVYFVRKDKMNGVI